RSPRKGFTKSSLDPPNLERTGVEPGLASVPFQLANDDHFARRFHHFKGKAHHGPFAVPVQHGHRGHSRNPHACARRAQTGILRAHVSFNSILPNRKKQPTPPRGGTSIDS